MSIINKSTTTTMIGNRGKGDRVYDTLSFILKATEIHKGFYIYGKVTYINSKSKVTITCPEHGDFEQTPNDHLGKHGCSKCSGNDKYTREEVIVKFMSVHRDTYTYNKVVYMGNRVPVTITCNEHGDFEQTPSAHLKGHGCPKCGVSKRIITSTKTTRQFKIDAKEIHGDFYSYCKVDYVHSATKVTITCPEHGDFEQTPNDHLSGKGCSKCGDERISLALSWTTEQFIIEAEQVHGDLYCYGLVEYENSRTPIPIKCKLHDHVFVQKPWEHLNSKTPCPVCRSSEFSKGVFWTLKKLKVGIETEVGLDGLNPMYKYDYYVSEYKTIIEVHGEQHYKLTPPFHRTEDEFKRHQERDRVKKEFALNKGLNYIEIAYTVDPKDLENILRESFNRLSRAKSGGISLTFKGKE